MTAGCNIGPVWAGLGYQSCRTHKHEGRGDGLLYARVCDAFGARYHAKYMLLRGYCSPACQQRDYRKRKANP